MCYPRIHWAISLVVEQRSPKPLAGVRFPHRPQNMFLEKSPRSNSEKEPKFIGVLSSGEKVFDRWNSHLNDNAELFELLPETLLKINSANQEFFVESIDLGREVGKSLCVETTTEDEIIYAQRKGRAGLTRFVKNRQADPTSFVTVILKKAEDGYVVITAFIGPKAEREPWDNNIKDDSEQDAADTFWNTHALLWDKEAVIFGTETRNPK